MHIAIMELPAQGIFKIKVDEQEVQGHIHRRDDGRWEIWLNEDKPLKTRPKSREAAAALIVYHHFETERKNIQRLAKVADGSDR